MTTSFGYEKLDQPEALKAIFHPRLDSSEPPPSTHDLMVDVADDVEVHVRCHLTEANDAPNILFFHGNGEIVADYDDIAPAYVARGLNFIAADFRGYGKSSGVPTVTAMVNDAHLIFEAVTGWLKEHERSGPITLMGRSLGSVSAIELAVSHTASISGLIIDSGIAQTMPLLLTLGIDTGGLGISEMDGFKNLQKIAQFNKPTYILHGQFDEIIPFAFAEILHLQCPARGKELQMVPGAGHNDIIQRTGALYFDAIHRFVKKTAQPQRSRRPGVRR